jgi:octopine/nopaline transport system substrate-binding protein
MGNDMRRNSRIGLLMSAAVLAGLSCASAQEKKVRLATDGNYPPFNFTDPSGKVVGFEVDLAGELCKRAKLSCDWVTQSFDGMIPGLNASRFDAIMASLSITEKRAESIDFSLPYYAGPTQFVAAAGSAISRMEAGRGQTLDLREMTEEKKKVLAEIAAALAKATVGVERASTHATFMQQLFPDVKVRIYDKEESLYLDLVSGRIDMVVSGFSPIRSFIERQKKENRDFVVFGPALRGGALGKGVALGFRKNEKELRELLNRAITEATQDGTVTRLTQKWMGFDGAVRPVAANP